MNVKFNSMNDLIYWYKGHIERVIDGDTVVFSEIDLGFDIALKNRHGRLLGINAPETRTKDQEIKIKGNQSKDYLTGRLTGKDVIIKSCEVDNFGRILCLIYLEEELINDTLLIEGYAVVFE